MTALSWWQARSVAATCAPANPEVRVSIDEAIGSSLVEPLVALADLPTFHTAAMDGYAVAGSGPWRIVGDVRAGQQPQSISAGQCVSIATGAPLPRGADAVLRNERAQVLQTAGGPALFAIDSLTGVAADGIGPEPGTDVRQRGEECRDGDILIAAQSIVTPQIAGLAAATGYDSLLVVPPPRVATLVIGDELLQRGLPQGGRVRDALGPMLPAWIAALGARANPPVRVPDTVVGLREEIEDAAADIIVTTGSTMNGPADHLRAVMMELGAHWLVDGVEVRPGHPMLMARLADGRFLVGLPGNPLAAVTGLLTLAVPLICAMRDVPDMTLSTATLDRDVAVHPVDVRLIPVVIDEGVAHPLKYAGPAMLRSLALADALAVIPPDSGTRGSEIDILMLPKGF